MAKYRTNLLVRFGLKVIPNFYLNDPERLKIHQNWLKKAGMNIKSLIAFLVSENT